ncbi:putative lipid II flippase FtsW [Candidatus Uhrbacteria bacterium]|nr:putative lipid II flippase FtsW [Candidatus Uhrbacteria bacterium]
MFRDGTPDYTLIVCFFLILGFGLVVLSSASSVVSFDKFRSPYFYSIHQLLFGFLPGLLCFYLASRIDYHIWERFSALFLTISIALLLLVFIPGLGFESGGAKRWVHFGGFVFQPSEVVKLTFLLYLAAWLTKKGETHSRNRSYTFLPFLILVGTIALLVILQPDMGTMGVIALISSAMYFLAGAPIRHLAAIAAGGVAFFFLLLKAAPYRMERFTIFLNPQSDPLGSGYHINQALLAIGSGGLFGRGFGLSRQKYNYLPEVVGDSIFAIIAEELGFLIAVALIATFMFFVIRALRVGARAPDQFGFLVAVGIACWFLFQSFINIAAMLSLLPLTGIPLPFISYGGSALMVGMTAVGILVNISRQGKTEKHS